MENFNIYFFSITPTNDKWALSSDKWALSSDKSVVGVPRISKNTPEYQLFIVVVLYKHKYTVLIGYLV